VTHFDNIDKDKNGVIDKEEWQKMQIEFERKRLED